MTDLAYAALDDEALSDALDTARLALSIAQTSHARVHWMQAIEQIRAEINSRSKQK